MELLVGETLAAWLTRGPLSEVTAARIGAAVADVLVTAHAMRLVHRDLKPENLFILDGDGAPGPERVRVVDFGIAFIEDAGDMGRLTAATSSSARRPTSHRSTSRAGSWARPRTSTPSASSSSRW